jgi:X-Pro dipeptidyl-peptidase
MQNNMKIIYRFISFVIIYLCSAHLMYGQSVQVKSPSNPYLIFENGESQPIAAFRNSETWIKEELWVETTFDSDYDGKLDRMHVFVTRPGQTQTEKIQLPVVYQSSPYYGLKIWALLRMSSNKYNWDVQHNFDEDPKSRKHPNLGTRSKRPLMAFYYDNMWVPRGYITVYSSSPGTGLSDGSPTAGGENESLAPKAVIDWLCGRAKGYTSRTGSEEVTAFWSSKKVGMMGTSYDGTLCIAAATTGVEGLEAIIPVAPVTSFYQYYRSNGLVRSPDGYPGEDIDVLYDVITTGDKSKRKNNDRLVRDSILVKNMDRKTGDYNDFWATRDYLNKINNMHAAMLMAHGFNDWNVMTEQSYRFYKAAKDKGLPVQLYYHQADHGGDPSLTMMNRWFTRYLHGVENGVENDKPVQIVREYATDATAYDSYPDADAVSITFFVQSTGDNNGKLQLSNVAQSDIDTLIDNYKISSAELSSANNSDHRLLFVTPVLEQDIRISGIPRITLRVSANEPAVNLSVMLVALPWEEGKEVMIYDNIITRGWADPQNYRSMTNGEKLEPGKFYDLSFDLMPDDQVIAKGQQIGLMIFSSDAQYTILPEPGALLMFDVSGIQITIPVVGGVEVLDLAGVK